MGSAAFASCGTSIGHYNLQIEDLKVKIDDLEKKLNKIVKKKGK